MPASRGTSGGVPRVEVAFTPAELGSRSLKGLALVLIDVLRFSTTACYALHHGADQVVPAESIEEATRLAATLDRETTLLCGEREGDRIDGFHLGNSPLEYRPATVGRRTLVFSTSNGTRLAALCEPAHEVAIAAMVNVGAVARWVARRRSPVLVVCAGRQGAFSMEDAVCAGLLLQRSLELAPALALDNDAARASIALAERFGVDAAAMLEGSEAGRYLVSRGYGDDLVVAAQVDALKSVPVLREGRITLPDLRAAARAAGPS